LREQPIGGELKKRKTSMIHCNSKIFTKNHKQTTFIETVNNVYRETYMNWEVTSSLIQGPSVIRGEDL
jgi:hypothetical protein